MDNHEIAWTMEWECLSQPIVINNGINIEGKTLNVGNIEIRRDEEYKITALINSNLGSEIYNIRGETDYKLGEQIKPLSISGLNIPFKYTLNHCYFGSTNSNFSRIANGEGYSISSVTELHTYEVVRHKLNNDKKTEVLIEWYINGPDTSFIFMRNTIRNYCEEYSRKRSGIQESTIKRTSEGSNLDHLIIRTKGFSFIIAKAGKGIGPNWSKNIAIEYSEKTGGIPEVEIRKAVAEIIGFIFGKQLLNVGYSEYTEDLSLLSFTAFNPWGNNIRSKCLRSSLFPFIKDDYRIDIHWLEEVVAELVDSYIQLRDNMQLNDVLNRYWLAEDVPLGVDLPLYANGIEILSKRWKTHNKNKIVSSYMIKKDFYEIIKPEIETLVKKLEQNADKLIYDKSDYKKIIKKLKDSNILSPSELMNLFLNQIGLTIGEKEKQSIWARNLMIHDIYNVKTDQWELVELHRGYNTYFNRVFLKVLGYKGEYIDYTVPDYPLRNIDEIPG